MILDDFFENENFGFARNEIIPDQSIEFLVRKVIKNHSGDVRKVLRFIWLIFQQRLAKLKKL